jgi:hypothetical protein
MTPGRSREPSPWRRIQLEARLALAPPVWLIPAAWMVMAAMHTGLGGGPGVWSRHWTENCEAFFPIAFGLASAPLLLVEQEDGQLEVTGAYPMARVARTRLLAVVGGGWAAVLAGLVVLRLGFGPVPFWSGVLAALGPGLFLGGLSCWAATASGRATLGYLLAVGVPVMDLVLRLLGGFQVLWPLQFINVFAWRWPLPEPPWWLVKVAMAGAGFALYARAAGYWRAYAVRQL